MKFVSKYPQNLFLLFAAFLLQSCFTGVESTKKITEDDVKKVELSSFDDHSHHIDSISSKRFEKWEKGDRFIVVDSLVSLIFQANSAELNVGDTLYYFNSEKENILGTDNDVVIIFNDKEGNYFRYKTRKTADEIVQSDSPLVIPFVVDLSIVNECKYLIGKDYYIVTPHWFDENGENVTGKKFVKVKIEDVIPGNKIYSLSICFSYGNKKRYVFVSSMDNAVSNRKFSNIFTENDPKSLYPAISDVNWDLIINGKVDRGMTKEEVQLSLDLPADINRIPTHNGLKEIWKYSNGVYLLFEDGILTQYRK